LARRIDWWPRPFAVTLSAMKNLNHTARPRVLVGAALAGLLVVSACGSDTKQSAPAPAPAGHAADAPAPAPAPAPSAPAAAEKLEGGAVRLAGVTYTPPAHWQDLGPSGMRQGQYRLPAAEGDKAPAEVNVFYFGPESGGGVEANLQRWIGQILLPGNVDPAEAVVRSTFTADGMPGHVVAVNGRYQAGGGPMGGRGEVLPGYRLVGVVIEGPEGSVFFKLTGPEATAGAMEGDLLAMVKGATR
jgi:hypothetical protein